MSTAVADPATKRRNILTSAQLPTTTIPLLLVATIWYLVVTSILSVGQYYLEQRFSRGGRTVQMSRLDRALRQFARKQRTA